MLEDLPTPSLLLDEVRLNANIARLQEKLAAKGVTFRPHLKSAKCRQIFERLAYRGKLPAITVSTLAEAENFAAAGATDLIYAVGLSPDKIDRALQLRRTGCDLKVIIDSTQQARMLREVSVPNGEVLPALIEIDCDGSRAGIRPADDALIQIASILSSVDGMFAGVLTHAGGSYGASSLTELKALAESERQSVVTCARRLEAEGIACPIISMGSTPTAITAESFDGVTEVRAGVFMFFDRVMEGLGVCQLEDMALSVLTGVIGHRPDRGWIIIDAGWSALSSDLGMGQADQPDYGLVCDENGLLLEGLYVSRLNQEHGVIRCREGFEGQLPNIPIGSRLRIMPNHACATSAQFDHFNVLHADASAISQWPRFRGW